MSSVLERLPARLPLELEELKAFAALLGASFDEHDLGPSGPYPVGRWGCDLPDELVARHVASDGDEPVEAYDNLVDIRTFRPFSELLFLGADATGDGLYVDPRRRTQSGQEPVMRFCHDQALTAELEANGLHEYAARGMLLRWANANGTIADARVLALLRTPVRLADLDAAAPLAGEPNERIERSEAETTTKSATKKRATTKSATKKRMTKKRATKKRMAKKRMTKKSATKKSATKKRATTSSRPRGS
jgi:hypothetical protein